MSEKLARELYSEARHFSETLATAGWVTTTDSFNDNKSPVDLFKTEERPLVVGLFGGTGVGKSSLLNRLADVDIARTGVVRPTSMEITAYLHNNVQLDALPEHFDTASFSANRHSNDALAGVMWVDMPDFDSDETQNKDQVLQWLPHIDLLIYVVTPERYKDAEGWRMMLDNGYRHAWLFVVNQWDRAEPVQYQDFVEQLAGAAFTTPEVFRTVCVGQHEDDQFDSMVEVISALSTRNIVKHLQERGWMQRLERSKGQLQQLTGTLKAGVDNNLTDSFTTRWQDFKNAAVAHLDAPFKVHSELFAEDKTSAVNSVLKSLAGKSSENDIATNIATRESSATLWDEWLTIRYRDVLQQFQLAGNEHGVAAEVFIKSRIADGANVDDVMARHLKQAIDVTLKTPGTPMQRMLAKSAYVLKIVLPLLALLWVAWRVVNGFITGAEDRTAYVGLDFLVNGLLLAGLGWLIPWIVEKVFVPSLPDSVYQALHRGLNSGLREIERQIEPQLHAIHEERTSYEAACTDLQQRIDRLLGSASATSDPTLNRVLMKKPGNSAE